MTHSFGKPVNINWGTTMCVCKRIASVIWVMKNSQSRSLRYSFRHHLNREHTHNFPSINCSFTVRIFECGASNWFGVADSTSSTRVNTTMIFFSFKFTTFTVNAMPVEVFIAMNRFFLFNFPQMNNLSAHLIAAKLKFY